MSLAADLAPHLSHLRRYARALTGSQVHGDAYVRACLETIVEAPEEFPREVGAKVGLYKVFYAIWMTAHVDEPVDVEGLTQLLQNDWTLPMALAFLAWYVYAPQCLATLLYQ